MANKKCPVAKKCSGCQLSNMTYEQQLEWKQKDTEKLLGGFGKVSEIIGADDPYNYRNKVQAVFRSDRNGRIISGVYQSSRNGIVGIDSCMLDDKCADEIIVGIRELLRSFKLHPYDEGTERGFLRHVLVRVGKNTGEILVTLVGGNSMFPKKHDFVKALVKRFPDITTVTFSVNRTPEMLLLGENNEVLYGEGYITDILCGKRFRISPHSFYQINHAQTEKLYDYAIKAAKLTKKDVLLDAYSGIGTIGIIASDYVKQVQGIEYNASAVRDAVKNCHENGLTRNIAFNRGDAGEFLEKKAKLGTHYDAVILDPARTGADRKFLNSLVKIAPERIVYISCNQATQARDLKTLTKKYTVTDIQPFDMFPHTRHVETVVLLSHKKPDGHINVKVEFGEGEGKVPLDNIAKRAEEYKPKERVTYKMIKEYIEAKYGFKVHTAYIAEVKRDLGLPMYDAPNAVEELKQQRKHPTPEKVEAIKDALKYFGVI